MELKKFQAEGKRALRQIGVLRMFMTLLFMGLAFIMAANSWKIPLMGTAERMLFDMRQFVSAPVVEQDDRILIVAYTDETLIKSFKRSPVDRTILAKALARLDRMGAKSIGIDILFDQPQQDDPLLIKTFQGMKTPTFIAHAALDSAGDNKIMYEQQQFLEAFQKSLAPGNVHPASIVIQTDADDNVLRTWADIKKGLPPRIINAMTPEFKTFSDYTGSIVYRRPKDTERPVFTTLPIDLFADDSQFEIPAVFDAMAEQVKGKYVLIGGNIIDTDLFQTPFSRFGGENDQRQMWGMNTFAHMIAQMGDNLRPEPLSAGVTFALTLLAVLAGGLTAMGSTRPLLTGSLLLVQLGAMAGLPFLLANKQVDTYNLPAFGWIVGWAIAFAAVGMAVRAISTEQRQFAQSAFGKYLPKDVAAQIMKDPENLTLTGEKREIFVLFTDLEGFTKLSHAIEPEMVATLLNRYLDMLSDVVLKHGGTIDKFVGDAVVAFWGAPISRPDDGKRAVEAAMAMYQAGEDFRNSAPPGVPKIGKTRVGLHHGEAIVGNFGGEGRIQYTALGDSMNTAARLESANKQTDSSILISREAVELSDLDIFRPLGKVVLRGRASAIEIFEPVPDMDIEERKALSALSEKAISGDVSAITGLQRESAKRPSDKALAKFVERLTHQERGGHYVLD